ncbi:MAG: patatin-like phospholipase family protein [Betaproteobacteria bacterium]|nr:patatin-like phospholipase family protein [Betaproteobacteria bacterium]
MTLARFALFFFVAPLLLLAGCATRPVNPPIAKAEPESGYRMGTRPQILRTPDALVILTFSGGGTRAAAFSYGVLEVLRKTEARAADGRTSRLIDSVDVITGVSGGSFTALAYGLYGERLFSEYETRFLKRNVQGELIQRLLMPSNWPALNSDGWGRSEMAAQLYDEVLFENKTFADLNRGDGPFVAVMATDISTGSRVGFVQTFFDVICSDLLPVKLSRVAATSSAVPVVMSPVTYNNYGGTCGFEMPIWTRAASDPDNPARPAARAIKRMEEVMSYGDGKARPFLHLVDGGLADNLGMRAVLEVLEEFEAARSRGIKTPLDDVKRIVVVVVNSLSTPKTNWDQSERPPGNLEILIKAAGVPIDRYSSETVELLRDMIARWDIMRRIRESKALDVSKDPGLAPIMNGPSARLYAIDVSFPQLKDPAEFAYLNDLPTSFVLTPEAVDRLRAAAGKILLDSPDFQQLLKDIGARVVDVPAAAASAPQ